MEPFIADLLKEFICNKKIPRALRYGVCIVIWAVFTGFFVFLAVGAPWLAGKIIIGGLAVLMTVWLFIMLKMAKE